MYYINSWICWISNPVHTIDFYGSHTHQESVSNDLTIGGPYLALALKLILYWEALSASQPTKFCIPDQVFNSYLSIRVFIEKGFGVWVASFVSLSKPRPGMFLLLTKTQQYLYGQTIFDSLESKSQKNIYISKKLNNLPFRPIWLFEQANIFFFLLDC